jgi:hypothetical protein
MQEAGSGSSDAPSGPTAVSPNNPCPFLRALVAEGFIDGHTVPLSTLSRTIEAASGETGLNERLAGLKTYLVALIANGLGPLHLLRNWWSGAQPDELRGGPLDKRGCGSRILDATAHVDESELARLAEFGKDRHDPSGGLERGLTAQEITTYMDANFERAKATRHWVDRQLMNGEWPVLLNIMGKGEGKERYLSVAEVRTLFVERRLPERIAARLPAPAPSRLGMFVQAALGAAVLAVMAVFLAVIELPDQVGKFVPPLAQILPPPLPNRAPVKSAVWLDQNWSTEDRHWFHHASQGTATFQVPYDWFMALEQPGLHLFTQPGLLSDTAYLERFGFLPSPKSVHTDPASLRRFGYLGTSNAPPAPESVGGLRPTAVENFDGLPVGFARLSGVTDPGTGLPVPDQIGLTCAACHTGSVRYKGTSVRFDGGPAMVDLKKLELATGLSVGYTLRVPGRFGRFVTRVLGPDATPEDYKKLKADLTALFARLLSQKNALRKGSGGSTRSTGSAIRFSPPIWQFPVSADLKRICTPRTRRSVFHRSGPCHGSCLRNMTPPSSSL